MIDKNMKLYLAPLEGNTGYIYRNAVYTCFGGFDKYFIPFINPNKHGKLSTREMNDILPEHNEGMYAVPQLLTKDSSEFVQMAEILRHEYGYKEINLNLGCPSRTVVSKGRGSGFLAYPYELEKFLDEIFEKCDVKISVKTRLGMTDAWEFDDLLCIYNKFPMEELIIHPRVQKDFYKNLPNLEAFENAYLKSENAVCYNGNIFSAEDYGNICERFQNLDCIMLGRGVMSNPALARQIRTGQSIKKDELRKFHNMLYEGYLHTLSGDKNVLYRMKELWSYLMAVFDNEKKFTKKIHKCERCSTYECVIDEMFNALDV